MPIDITEFKNDASGWIERLQNQPPVVLTEDGRGKAVVQSYESYQQQRYAMALLKRVIQGQADATAGRTLAHDQVMAEARARIDSAMASSKSVAIKAEEPAPRKPKARSSPRRRA